MCLVVNIRSKVRAMCFVAICAWAIAFKVLVRKVLKHVVMLYFEESSKLQRRKRSCAVKMYALALKSVVTLKVQLFYEDQKVYKCGETLVSFGLYVDYSADRFNSSALTGITADTLIALGRDGFIFLWKHYYVGIRTLFTLQTHWRRLSYVFFKLQTHFCAGVKWDLKTAVLR